MTKFPTALRADFTFRKFVDLCVGGGLVDCEALSFDPQSDETRAEVARLRSLYDGMHDGDTSLALKIAAQRLKNQ